MRVFYFGNAQGNGLIFVTSVGNGVLVKIGTEMESENETKHDSSRLNHDDDQNVEMERNKRNKRNNPHVFQIFKFHFVILDLVFVFFIFIFIQAKKKSKFIQVPLKKNERITPN